MRRCRHEIGTHGVSDSQYELNLYRRLSDCNRILNFQPQFPVLPRKISEYLRTDFHLDANTRIMKGSYNNVSSTNCKCL